jgi:hypothetical protein
MKIALKSALAAFALAAAGVPASAQHWDQLIASAGLSRSEAAGMTLSQIAAYKFNRDASGDDRQTIPVSVSVSTAARNHGVSGADKQTIKR